MQAKWLPFKKRGEKTLAKAKASGPERPQPVIRNDMERLFGELWRA